MLRRRRWRRLVRTIRWRTEHLSSRTRLQLVLLLIAATASLSAWGLHTPRHIATTPVNPPAVKGIVTVSTDHPSETQPTTSTYHSTATGQEPAAIRLTTIQAAGFIQKVGIDQHHQIAVPTNIHLAGWFTDTVIPGDLGLSIIDGHVDGYRQPGIFAQLGRLKPGDVFEIQLADSTTRKFRVKTVTSLATADAASALFSQTPGLNRQLNLITCGGTFSQTAKAYDHRIVVTSEYISG